MALLAGTLEVTSQLTGTLDIAPLEDGDQPIITPVPTQAIPRASEELARMLAQDQG